MQTPARQLHVPVIVHMDMIEHQKKTDVLTANVVSLSTYTVLYYGCMIWSLVRLGIAIINLRRIHIEYMHRDILMRN